MHAPYVKLTPIEEDDNMEVVGGEEKVVARNSGAAISKEATLCCIYCHDVGSYIWRCIQPTCGITVCVRKEEGDHGCVDAAPDKNTGKVMVTEETFRCPQCYRGDLRPLPYMIYGYSVRQDYLHRNYFPLLAIFLTWSGFGSSYASNTVQAMLREQFSIDQSRLRIATRALKSGNNNPSAMNPHFEWLANANYEGNVLLFINTHSDTDTGDLVVSGDPKHAGSVPLYEASGLWYDPTSSINPCLSDSKFKKRKPVEQPSAKAPPPAKKAAVAPTASASKPMAVKRETRPIIAVKDARSDSSFFSAPKPKAKLPSFKKAPAPVKREPDLNIAQPSSIDPFQEALNFDVDYAAPDDFWKNKEKICDLGS
ncbi:hypothetical protein BDR03DRAFT_1019667 [Suillus americanus]|nr:hypothetical protein BDR03DRAFT_1019667 [Suillus americanus]